jgi:signal transduction histidine kinase
VTAAAIAQRCTGLRGSLPLLRFTLMYIILHFTFDYVAQLTELENGVSLWFPAAGLIFAVVLRLRLIGAVLVIATSVTSFLLFPDSQFSLPYGILYCVLGPIILLVIRSVMRRSGYIDPRARPRPELLIIFVLASSTYALWSVILANILAAIDVSGKPLSLVASFEWWLGDMVGITAIASFMFQFVFPYMLGEKSVSLNRILKGLPSIFGYGMLSLIPWMLSFMSIAGQNQQLIFLAAVPIFYAALRRGLGETSLALVFANLGFMLAAHKLPQSSALELQSMALMINIGGLMAATISTNQNAMLKALRQTLSERDRLTTERAGFERKLAETQRLDALGRMAGGMAHEINNLLHPIKSFARSAATATEDKRLHYLGRINDCADNAHRIVSDVLIFARDAVENPVLELQIIEAQKAVEASLAIAADSLPRLIKCTSDIKLGMATIRCDVGSLSQVMANLINNARDAMLDGGTITVIADVVTKTVEQAERAQIKEGHYVSLQVQDDGQGMDETITRRVFEPFFTTKDMGRGTGLGLSVVFGIIRRWQGTIMVESIVGAGTTFTILIPLATDA